MAIHRDKECIVRLFRYEIRNFLVPCLSLAFGEVRCHPPIIAPAIRIHIAQVRMGYGFWSVSPRLVK